MPAPAAAPAAAPASTPGPAPALAPAAAPALLLVNAGGAAFTDGQGEADVWQDCRVPHDASHRSIGGCSIGLTTPLCMAGNAFTANDALYFGTTGTVLTKDNKAIAGAAASSWPLYDTLIQGAHLTATLPLPATPPGTALSVILYFAELYWSAAGARSCNWAFNGGPLALPAPLDVVAAAGARNTALQMSFQVGGAQSLLKRAKSAEQVSNIATMHSCSNWLRPCATAQVKYSEHALHEHSYLSG